MGQAHSNGDILIDLSLFQLDVGVLEFWLAHEWGHQTLGHVTNQYIQSNGINGFLHSVPKSQTHEEDEADLFAARFLATRHSVSIYWTLDFLCNLPENPTDLEHSSGVVRAANVAAEYARITGIKPINSCGKKIPIENTLRVIAFGTSNQEQLKRNGSKFDRGRIVVENRNDHPYNIAVNIKAGSIPCTGIKNNQFSDKPNDIFVEVHIPPFERGYIDLIYPVPERDLVCTTFDITKVVKRSAVDVTEFGYSHDSKWTP